MTSKRITAKEAQALLGKKREHKYRAKQTTVNGIKFTSKAEAKRWGELRIQERAGEIEELKRQERFPLTVNGEVICHYVADFTYFDCRGHFIIEDVKGFRTDVYNLKRKLMKAVHGIDIVEVGGRKARQKPKSPRAKLGQWTARNTQLRAA